MKKTILIFMMLSLTIASFSKEKEESVKENKKIEISQSEKEDYKKIREDWAEYLSGVPKKADILTMNSKEFLDICAANDSSGDNSYKKINRDLNKTYLFKGYTNMANGVHVLKSYEEFKNVARAYATPNTKYYKHPKVKED